MSKSTSRSPASRRVQYSSCTTTERRGNQSQQFSFPSPVSAMDDDVCDVDHSTATASDNMSCTLRSRGANGSHASLPVAPPDEFITEQVTPDSTLQNISIKYAVSVSELKRINGLFADNELHTRSWLKIPVRPHSLLIERLSQQTTPIPTTLAPSAASSITLSLASTNVHRPTTATHASDDSSTSSSSSLPLEVGETTSRPGVTRGGPGSRLLRKVDRQVNAARSHGNELLAESVLLSPVSTTASISTLDDQAMDNSTSWTKSSLAGGCIERGDDCGLQWYCLVAAVILLLLVLPVWYIVFEYEKGELTHHDDHQHHNHQQDALHHHGGDADLDHHHHDDEVMTHRHGAQY